MRILLYGELWEGTHVDIIRKILLKKEIDCKAFDFFAILNYSTPITLANRVLRRLFYTLNEKAINKKLVEEIDSYKPDIFLISKGINIFPETLHEFQQRGILVVNWNMDDFFNPLNNSPHLLASLDIYDYVFSPRPQMFEKYKAAGIRRPIFSESYYVPWLHAKPASLPPLEKKVSFVGSFSKRRESIIGAIDAVYPIEIWGAGWGLSSLNRRKNIDLKNKVMKQADFPKLISKNLLNLNTLTLENNDLTNLKVFEITACYGLLMTEYNEYTESLLQDGALYYSVGTDDLYRKLGYVFDPRNADEMEYKRARGHELIINGKNTINDRVDDVLNIILNR